MGHLSNEAMAGSFFTIKGVGTIIADNRHSDAHKTSLRPTISIEIRLAPPLCDCSSRLTLSLWTTLIKIYEGFHFQQCLTDATRNITTLPEISK